jgi:luciferase family oxidoreductase group 1
MTLPLSVLDLCQIESGSSSAVALRNAVELAQAAERLGYTRYWFAEHHNTASLASGSPEIMIGHVAGRTSTIRVGAGGVMLPNHAPLRIAEAFHLLEALFPGRIDLGLGRAPGTDTLTAYALRRSEAALHDDQYPALLAELQALDTHLFPAGHPFAAISVTPADVSLPPLWLLGSSDFSAQLAAAVGLRFSFAAHINPRAAVPVMRLYREQFTPSDALPRPQAMLAVGVVVGETEEQAAELSEIVAISFAALRAGKPRPMLTLAELRALPAAEREQHRMQRPGAIAGVAASVAARVRELAEETQADEVMLVTLVANQADRLRAVTQIAAEWGMRGS